MRHNQESQRRQYDLANQARALEWAEVVVIDDDLGKSGASSAERFGFQRLVAEVSLGRVGAIFSIEVSRLARHNRDWYQLLDLCGWLNTLIIDADGVYDVRQLNDRLLLGLKGTSSEVELGWIRLPSSAAPGRRGCGFANNRSRCRRSWRTTVGARTSAGSCPSTTRCSASLIIPCMPAPMRSPQRHTHARVVEGQAHKTRGHRNAPAQWLVLLHDHHAAYSDWQTYDRNQQIIAENAQMKGAMRRGAARSGRALRAGLLRCGQCGRRLHVHYAGHRGEMPRYSCRGAMINHGADRCISFGGLRVDGAIEREVLRVLTPAAIEAALTAAEDCPRADRRHAAGAGAGTSPGPIRGGAGAAPVRCGGA